MRQSKIDRRQKAKRTLSEVRRRKKADKNMDKRAEKTRKEQEKLINSKKNK